MKIKYIFVLLVLAILASECYTQRGGEAVVAVEAAGVAVVEAEAVAVDSFLAPPGLEDLQDWDSSISFSMMILPPTQPTQQMAPIQHTPLMSMVIRHLMMYPPQLECSSALSGC